MCPPLSHPFGATSCQPLRWPKGEPVGEVAGGRAARALLGMLLATLHMTNSQTTTVSHVRSYLFVGAGPDTGCQASEVVHFGKITASLYRMPMTFVIRPLWTSHTKICVSVLPPGKSVAVSCHTTKFPCTMRASVVACT
jgi:hypothetical protein